MPTIIRLFIFVTIVSSLILPGQVAAQPAPLVPTVSVNPASAAPGTQVQLKGQGFTPQDPLVVQWDSNSPNNPILAQGIAGADGSAVFNVIIPPGVPQAGNHTLWMTNGRGTETASAGVMVNAANRKAAFIYNTDSAAASGFQTLLNANGIQTTLFQLGNINGSTKFSAYDLIVLGSDTGSANTWGDATKVLVVLLSGKPVLGIGEGGYAFFGRFGSPIGYPNGALSSADSVSATSPTEPLYNQPNSIPLISNQVLVLTKATNAREIPLNSPDSRTYEFGAFPTNLSNYALIQSGRYFLWGFTNPVVDFTPEGANLFVNAAWYLINILSRDTLVVTNFSRMSGIGFPAADVSTLQTKVTELIGLPYATTNMYAVWRDLTLDGPDTVARAYTAWTDANMHFAAQTNTLVSTIDNYIEKLKRAAYPNLKYIILVGSHEVIPMKVRPADNYKENDWGIPGGYLYDLAHSGTNGSYLTDTVYSDLSYVVDGWAPNSELVPELSIGRLVETPAQITTLLNTYIGSSASMSRTNKVAIGSNDYLDGAQAAANAMGSGADDSLNQSGFDSILVPPLLNAKHGIVYIGGHGDFNWMTTQKWGYGFMAGSSGVQGDTEELVNLPNAVIVAAGCHNGANFTNMKYRNYDGSTSYGDFPERFANKQVGVYIGSTGYTWITISDASKAVSDVGFSERLVSLYVDKLLNTGGTTAGKAFQETVKAYVAERPSLSDADRRVLAIAAFYGIPNYRFSSIYRPSGVRFGYFLKTVFLPLLAPSTTPTLPVATNTQVTLTLNNWSIGPDGVVLIPGASYTGDENYPILPEVTANWNLPGAVSGLNATWDEAASQSTTVNNVVPNAVVGTTQDLANQLIYEAPKTLDLHGFYPQSLQFTSTTSNLGGGDTTLSLGIMPVQFNPDTGQTRIWTKLVFNLSYSTESDAANADNDGDGLPDYWENTYGLNPQSGVGNDGPSGDPDQDGLTNLQEFQLGTDPLNPDTDQDGYTDGQEVQSGFDPLNPGNPLQLYLPGVAKK